MRLMYPVKNDDTDGSSESSDSYDVEVYKPYVSQPIIVKDDYLQTLCLKYSKIESSMLQKELEAEPNSRFEISMERKASLRRQ